VIVAAIATGALWLAVEIIDYLSTLLPAKGQLLMSAGANLDESVAAIIFALSILGPFGASLAHLLLSTLYVGFRYAGFQDDADREWLARLSAVSVFPALLWAIFALICLLLPFVFIHNDWRGAQCGCVPKASSRRLQFISFSESETTRSNSVWSQVLPDLAGMRQASRVGWQINLTRAMRRGSQAKSRNCRFATATLTT
jgi:hypothetical protein